MNLYAWHWTSPTYARAYIDGNEDVNGAYYFLTELDMYTNDDTREYVIGCYASVANAKKAWYRRWGTGYKWYPKCRGCGHARMAGHVCGE